MLEILLNGRVASVTITVENADENVLKSGYILLKLCLKLC